MIDELNLTTPKIKRYAGCRHRMLDTRFLSVVSPQNSGVYCLIIY